MTSFDYTIKDELGLHARPAGVMVKRLKEVPANISVMCGTRRADGKKLFQLMGMAVKQGETVTVEIDGENEEALREELLAFFAENY